MVKMRNKGGNQTMGEERNCLYCEGNVDSRHDVLKYFNVYICGNGYLTNDEENEQTKINFCPMCGKRL